MSSQNIAIYSDCVDSLHASFDYLESSVSILDAGVSDLPRLSSVLKTVRHYELIPQPTLAAAEASLRDEIAPSVALLLGRAERQVDRQQRRIDSLKAKSELQRGRLSAAARGSDNSNNDDGDDARHRSLGTVKAKAKGKQRAGGRRITLGGGAGLRARAVRQRKEALEYSIGRLELEVSQKERELRRRLDV